MTRGGTPAAWRDTMSWVSTERSYSPRFQFHLQLSPSTFANKAGSPRPRWPVRETAPPPETTQTPPRQRPASFLPAVASATPLDSDVEPPPRVPEPEPEPPSPGAVRRSNAPFEAPDDYATMLAMAHGRSSDVF
jgi:hypothetical protein